MDNKTARKTIKTLMGAIKLNYESELDMKFSFDMYLESIGLGKPKEVIKEKYPNKKQHEPTDFASVHKRNPHLIPPIIGILVGIIGVFGLIIYLVNFNKYAVIGSIVAIVIGLISVAYIVFSSRHEYYYVYDKGISEQEAIERARQLNEQDNEERKKIDKKYEDDLVEYQKRMAVYVNVTKEKKEDYKEFIDAAKKVYETTLNTINRIESEIGFYHYTYEDYEAVYSILIKRPDLDLDEAAHLANEIEKENAERQHAAYLREQEEQRWIEEQYRHRDEMRAREREADRAREDEDRRMREERRRQESLAQDQRAEQRRLAEQERRRQREEQDRLEREGRFAALRLCKACANKSHCSAQGHLKTGSCGGFRPI